MYVSCPNPIGLSGGPEKSKTGFRELWAGDVLEKAKVCFWPRISLPPVVPENLLAKPPPVLTAVVEAAPKRELALNAMSLCFSVEEPPKLFLKLLKDIVCRVSDGGGPPKKSRGEAFVGRSLVSFDSSSLLVSLAKTGRPLLCHFLDIAKMT